MTNTNLELIIGRYLNQSMTEFHEEGGNIREFAQQVFAGEIFGNDNPAAPDLGIETEEDLVAALEAAAAAAQE